MHFMHKWWDGLKAPAISLQDTIITIYTISYSDLLFLTSILKIIVILSSSIQLSGIAALDAFAQFTTQHMQNARLLVVVNAFSVARSSAWISSRGMKHFQCLDALNPWQCLNDKIKIEMTDSVPLKSQNKGTKTRKSLWMNETALKKTLKL